jgi:AcrR family transcriptional regulator
MAGRRPGRPAADTGTREAILEAARRQFAERGFQGTTLRGVATKAGVDARLVLHYFGSKAGLFQASVELPIDPEALAAEVFAPGIDGVARRIADRLVGLLEDSQTRQGLLALLRAAVADPEAAISIRAVLAERVIRPIAIRLGVPHAERRAAMVGTLLVGVTLGRYVVAFEPLASMSREQLVDAIAPVIEHYLMGDWATGAPA